jgi:NAD(P)-dependent dehydrogenase (short-subunit alcohol dehydrogenase family)
MTAPTVLVTGATSGLGTWLAHRLAAEGATVLVHGRDKARVDRLVAEIGPAAIGKRGPRSFAVRPAQAAGYVADLASLADTRRLAGEVADRGDLTVLINNAALGFGAPGSARGLSADGHELRWAVNYLAPVLLARQLLPTLAANAPARIVNVGSLGQVPIDFDDLTMAYSYDGIVAYRRAKLALAAFTFDLADDLRGTGVTATCIHPATFMDTAMVREYGGAPLSTVDDGGPAVLALAIGPQHAATSGRFFDGLRATRAHPDAYDPAVRRRLRAATDAALAGT